MRWRTTARTALTATLLAFVAGAGSLAASQVSGTMEVSAVVVPNCRFTLTPLNFGSYDPMGSHQEADLDATAQLEIVCTRNSQAAISMDGGQAPIDGTSLRGLVSGDQVLQYQIFRDANRRDVWGTGADALQFRAIEKGSNRRQFSVYGRIPAAQDVGPGMYFDVVTATVDF